MLNNTIFYIQAPCPPKKLRERERERERGGENGGRKYVHQEGMTNEPVEKVLMSLFLLLTLFMYSL